jgi:hypothetical protein
MNERDFIPLMGIVVPESLPMALGYRGPGRFLSIFWSVENDDLHVSDGRMKLGGHGGAWWRYVRHPRIATFLRTFSLGEGHEVAKHTLLIDIETGKAWVAPRDIGEKFVREAAIHKSGSLLQELFTPEEIARINATGLTPDDMERIKAHVMPEPETDEDVDREFYFTMQATRNMMRELGDPTRCSREPTT